MSDASVLSHEYKRALDYAHGINGALITLKTRMLDLDGAEEITEEELAASREFLASILAGLTAALVHAPGDAPSGDDLVSQIPSGLIGRLRQSHRGDLPYFTEELISVARRLSKDAHLEERDLELLDAIAAAADVTTSTVFRRLIRT